MGSSGNGYANAPAWAREDSQLISIEVPQVKGMNRRSVMTSESRLPPRPRALFKTSIFQVNKNLV